MKYKYTSSQKNWKQTFFMSCAVILAAQINISFFINNFMLSVGILLFPVFMFLTDSFFVITTTLLSAIGVFLTRTLFFFSETLNLTQSIQDAFPEFFFYITYGTLFSIYYYRYKDHLSKRTLLIVCFFLDYIANLVELLIRLGSSSFTWHTHWILLLVAAIRSAGLYVLLSLLAQYQFVLLKKEHVLHYQQLLLLISKLNGEVIWMKKNAVQIEQTMSTSYHLYEALKQKPGQEDMARSALLVANDVHEIKKEYALIMRGISDALKSDLKDEPLELSSLFQILKPAADAFAAELGKELDLSYTIPFTCRTKQPYLLMSIFRNLINNALEAAKKVCHIHIDAKRTSDHYEFFIQDDGPGIPEEFQTQIFDIGFSTKINYETGEINRGLGLNLVKSCIEEDLHGSISFSSRPGSTIFHIQIPISMLEVTNAKNLSD